MEAICLHWKLRADFQRFSLVPPWDLSFGQKRLASILSSFLVCASVVTCTWKRKRCCKECLFSYGLFFCGLDNFYFGIQHPNICLMNNLCLTNTLAMCLTETQKTSKNKPNGWPWTAYYYIKKNMNGHFFFLCIQVFSTFFDKIRQI